MLNLHFQILLPAAQERSFSELAVFEEFVANRHDLQTIVIGIDARYVHTIFIMGLMDKLGCCSIWFMQAQFGFHIGHAQAGENPKLHTIFYKLANLLQIPVTPLFVFDGPERPSVKHNVNVIKKSNWLTQPMQDLLDVFGFAYHIV